MKISKYFAATLLITLFPDTQSGIKKFAAESCAQLSREEQAFTRGLILLNQERFQLEHKLKFNKKLTTAEITEIQNQLATIQASILIKIKTSSENNQRLVNYANYTIEEFLTRQKMKVNDALLHELNRKPS